MERTDPKLSVSSVQPDHLYRTGPGLTQLEFAKKYRRDVVPPPLLRHREYMAVAYPNVVVEQHLVLMCQANAPKKVPSFYRKRLGKYKQRIDFEMVRLWELDPERAFELAHPALLPWVLVLCANQAQWRKP